jgi:hypothetical protein
MAQDTKHVAHERLAALGRWPEQAGYAAHGAKPDRLSGDQSGASAPRPVSP